MTIGGGYMNIKRQRMSQNMTQQQLADKLNVVRTTVAMWENGNSMPRSDKLPELARILKCNVSDLFDRKCDQENRR